MKKTAVLRRLLREKDILVAPGAYDPLSAKLIEAAGFPLIYMGGFAASAAYLGEPDIGLMSFAEMVDHLRRAASAVSLPVIADADTGYGNTVNVMRTVQAYEDIGIAGMHIEDQVMPKRCGHMPGKEVIPVEDMVRKIRAAVNARRDPDFLIIARTDAGAVSGFGEAVRRGKIYEAAGADMLFIEAPESQTQLEDVCKSFKTPVLYNSVIRGRSPVVSISRARQMGFKLIIYPIDLLMASCCLAKDILTRVMEQDGFGFMADGMFPFSDFNEFIGLFKYRQNERQCAAEAADILAAFKADDK